LIPAEKIQLIDELAAMKMQSWREPAEQADGGIRALDLHDLASHQFKERSPLIAPIINTQDLVMVFAGRGIGKTHFSLAIAFAVATGGTFGPWRAARPASVLYLDGELPGVVMQRRCAMHLPDAEPAPGFFRVFTPDLLPDGLAMPDLSTVEGQDRIEGLIAPDTALVVIDNLSAWVRTGNENDADSWHAMSTWLLKLRRRGLAVLLVHHAGKGGQQRGTSKREDLLDVVISLSRPKDYDPKQGAVFEMAFTKARHITGRDADSLQFTLGGTEERAEWIYSTVEESTYERVVVLARDGLSQAEIAAELDLNKSTISRHMRKAREEGLITAPAKGAL
jgi:hypothetical protein